MASAFALASNIYDGRYMRLSCVQTKDIATNKSKIDWVLETKGGNSNYYGTGPTTVTIAGQQVYNKGRTNWETKVFPAAKGSVSGTVYVDHDSQGKKSISVSFTTAIYVDATSTYSGTWTLDDIPRQTTVTSVPESFTSSGEPPTIYYNNPVGDNVTILELCIADKNAYHIYAPYREIDKNQSYYKFTASDIEVLKQIAGNSLDLSFVIRTNINGEYFYDWKPSTFTMVEDETTKPSISMSVELSNDSLPNIFDGIYIQNKSRLKVELSASGKYGASITGYSSTIDGSAYYSDNFTSNVLTNSGKLEVVGTVTDSRRFTNSVKKEIDVIPYRKPYVLPIDSETAISCYRSDGNGKRVGNSTSVWIKAKRDYYSVSSNGVQKNFCALQWRKKLIDEAWDDGTHLWKDLISQDNTSNNEYNALITNEIFELSKSYTVQVRAIDNVGESDVKTFEIPTQDIALHLGKGGKNVSVGAYCDYSQDYTFYSDWNAYFDKNASVSENLSVSKSVSVGENLSVSNNVFVGGNQMTDFIVEEGESGIWTYRKWNSGIAECWGVSNEITQTTSFNWNIMTSNTPTPSVAYPFAFKNAPVVSPSVHTRSANFWLVTYENGSNTHTPKYQIARGQGETTVAFNLGFYVVGYWK